MIPGVAFFYSGLLRRKNALSQLWLGMVGVGVVSFQVSLILPRNSTTRLLTSISGSFGVTPWLSPTVQIATLVT